MANFIIAERRIATASYFGDPCNYTDVYDVKRVSDGKILTTRTDYLEALKYLEALEDRYWLVS